MQEREKYNLDSLDPLRFFYAFFVFWVSSFFVGEGESCPYNRKSFRIKALLYSFLSSL